jgi:Na+-driven multidrug efflux pump
MIGILLLRPAIAQILIFTLDLGLMGAWLAIAADQIVRTTLVTIVYNRGKWKSIKLTTE